MAITLHTREVADWLAAGWGSPPDWPAQPEWQPGSATFLSTQPDRVAALSLQGGQGIVLDGAAINVNVLIGTRGNQKDPADGEDLAWAVWSLMTDPAASQSPTRRLLGDGNSLVIVEIEALAIPSFAVVDIGAQRVEHTCTYSITVGTATA